MIGQAFKKNTRSCIIATKGVMNPMLTDFERKLAQIIRNDRVLGRLTNIDDLRQRTGHSAAEIETVINKLREMPESEGGLK
jgi:hypothetical protein